MKETAVGTHHIKSPKVKELMCNSQYEEVVVLEKFFAGTLLNQSSTPTALTRTVYSHSDYTSFLCISFA